MLVCGVCFKYLNTYHSLITSHQIVILIVHYNNSLAVLFMAINQPIIGNFIVFVILGEHFNITKDLMERALNVGSLISIPYLTLPLSSYMNLSKSVIQKFSTVQGIKSLIAIVESHLCHLLAVCPRINYLNSLSQDFRL